jgi:hypothetical protein
MVGMFLTPEQALQAEREARFESVQKMSGGDPFQMGGIVLGQALGQALTGPQQESPDVQVARKRADIMKGLDLTSLESLSGAATNALMSGDYTMANDLYSKYKELVSMTVAAKKAEKSDESNPFEGELGKNVLVIARLQGLDLNNPEDMKKAYGEALKYKRQDPMEGAEVKLFETRMNGLTKEYPKIQQNYDDSRVYVDTVMSEIQNSGGLQGFGNKYRLYFGPASNFVTQASSVLGQFGIDLGNVENRKFISKVQMLNTKQALGLMSQLGGNDSNEELKRVMAGIASVEDGSPESFVSKLILSDLKNRLELEKNIYQQAVVEELGTDYTDAKFSEMWGGKKGSKTDGGKFMEIVKEWEGDHADVLSGLGEKGAMTSGPKGQAKAEPPKGATKMRKNKSGVTQYLVNGEWVDSSGNPVGVKK